MVDRWIFAAYTSWRFRTPVLLVAILFPSACLVGSPREIVQTALDRLDSVHSIACHIEYRRVYYSGTTANAGFDVMTNVDAATRYGRRFRVRQDTSMEFVFNGRIVRMIDRTERTVIVDTNRKRDFFSGRFVSPIITSPPISSAPLSNVLTASTSMELGIDTIISGHVCARVEVVYPDNQFSSKRTETWFISREDFFPRMRLFSMLVNGQRDTTEFHWSNIQFDVPIRDADIDPPSPVGFTESIYSPPVLPQPLGAGTLVPEWRLADAEGGVVSMADLRGKIVLLDFWGTWCAPCITAMPMLQKVHEAYASKGVIVTGVSCREPANARPARVLEDRGCTYRTLIQGDSLAARFNVVNFPTLYVIDRSGRVVDVAVGYAPEFEGELTKLLDELIASPTDISSPR